MGSMGFLSFTINGKEYNVSASDLSVDTSLNTFIRNHANLTGTKFMCLEGGCGVCIVALKGIHPGTKEKTTWAVNSCLFPVFSCHGLDVITVEGLGNAKDGYHPIQERLAHLNGTQCGYCSPGMVMNMYGLMEHKGGKVSMEEVENSFGSNICRCTGYRPILDAFKSLATNADEKLISLCRDIEDLPKKCPKNGLKCEGRCHQPEKKNFKMAEGREWHKVLNLKDVFSVLEAIGDKGYMLVAGNTAHGVYRRDPNIEVFIDVNSVDELRKHNIGDTIELGGNVNLTEMMEILEKAAKQKPVFEYCRVLINHIDVVASVPVRNTGTIAGNLSIKHANIGFPSDIFLILEAVNAKMTIIDGSGKTEQVSIQDYLKLDMKKKVILKITLPALDPSKIYVRSFKIMPRAQNAHAYVNAAFLYEFSDSTRSNLIQANICFGGINSDFVHATETEKLLKNVNLFDDVFYQKVLSTLGNELKPDWELPDASPEYRKNLALALFYKSCLSLCPDEKLKPQLKSGATQIDRDLSSGTQTFDTYEKNWPLTQPVKKLEAMIQVSGEAKYMNDFPYRSDDLWAAFVLSTEAKVKIGKIDPSEALKIPGVVAFFSAKDIPGINSFVSMKCPFTTEHEEIFASDIVAFHGQPLGVIVAESHSLANSASKLVKVMYEKLAGRELLPTLRDVIEAKAWHRIAGELHTKPSQEGVAGSHQITGHFDIGSQYHYTMEPQTTVCVPAEDGLDVYSSTQWMDQTQVAIAECLKVPENSINVQVRRVGGGYGGKITRSGQIACAAALACHRLQRVVRFVMTIEQNMTAIGKRYAVSSEYECDFDDNGKITKMKNSFLEDFGCSGNEDVTAFANKAFMNVYEGATWDIKSQLVKTDAPGNTWCRAPGNLEGMAMIENIMEHISRVAGRDANDVRLLNMPAESPMRKIFTDFRKSTEFDVRKKEIDAFNDKNRWKKRGISLVPMTFHLEYFFTFPALVSVYHGDGSVSITHGGIEMGQGIHTKAAQVAAHILGIPLDKISVKPSNVLTAPNSLVSGGSMASDSVAFAVMKACQNLLDRMKPIRVSMKDATWEQICQACFFKGVDLCSTYMFKPTDAGAYHIYGVTCTEMEVDLLTGNVQLRRVDMLEDTGESLSPNVDVGQVEGSFIMGVGYWLHEALVFNRQNGELLTNRTWTYKPPGAKDIPVDFRITFLQKSSNPAGVLRSKATGEPALAMSCGVIFALRNALDSARKDAGLSGDWYNIGAPSTPDEIFLRAGNKIEDFRFQ
ncbi:xanthine dehydrogenase [Sergentomyia squamirostris]